MAFTTTWNTAYEAIPAGTASASQIDTFITVFKVAIRERVAREHNFGMSDGEDQGTHIAGSAKMYYQAAEPTLRPDGATSLDSDDAGRVWVDSDTEQYYHYDGTDMVPLQSIYEQGGNILKVKIVEIGDWDMDADEDISVEHGLTLSDIVAVDAFILNDTGSAINPLVRGSEPMDGEMQGWVASISSDYVNLVRLGGGLFDSTSFDSTSYNRGYIKVWYVA